MVKSCVIVIPGCGPVLDIDDPGLGEEMTEMLLDSGYCGRFFTTSLLEGRDGTGPHMKHVLVCP